MANADEIHEFVKHAETVIRNFEKSLGWNDNDNRENKQDLIKCPINKNHLISSLRRVFSNIFADIISKKYQNINYEVDFSRNHESAHIGISQAKKCIGIYPLHSAEKHARTCKWRQWGYSKKDTEEIIFEEDDLCTANKRINIDEFITTLVPHAPPLRTDQAFKTYLNNEQRLKVYDFIFQKIQKTNDFDPTLYYNLHQAINNSEDAKRQKSDAEIVKEMRYFKRRRQSYRAKNVHITKRSHTEIVREVLNIHMDELTQLWAHSESSTKNQAKNPGESLQSQKSDECSSRDTFSTRSRDLPTSSRDVRSASSSRFQKVSDRNLSRRDSLSRRARATSRDTSRDVSGVDDSRDRENSPKKKKHKKEKKSDEKRSKKGHKNKHKRHKR